MWSGEARDASGMRAKQMGWKRVFVGASVALFGCGGSDGGGGGPPANCLQVASCGGDVVGRWLFFGGCVADASVFSAEAQTTCPGTEVSSVAYAASGTVAFKADLTYVAQGWQTSYSDAVTSDLSCTSNASCAEGSVSVSLSDGSFLTDTCSGDTVCTCSSSSRNVMTESGTYVVTGTQLELTSPTTTRNRSFCVEGSRLHVVSVSDATGAILADAVAQRQ